MNIDALQNKVLQHLHAGELKKASAICNKIIKKSPDNVFSLHMLGKVAYRQDKFQDTAKFLKRALKIQPKNADILLEDGRPLRLLKQYEKAIKYLRQSLTLNTTQIALVELGLSLADNDDDRKFVLNSDYQKQEYNPKHIAIDNYSTEGTSAPKVLEAIKTLGLESLVKVCVSDFRGYSKQIDKSLLPLDLVWFDCGGRHEYIDFLHEYWDLINPDHGLLLLHFTYWDAQPLRQKNTKQKKVVLSSIANEIKRQQLKAGIKSEFEVLSLLEPHKTKQDKARQGKTRQDKTRQDKAA